MREEKDTSPFVQMYWDGVELAHRANEAYDRKKNALAGNPLEDMTHYDGLPEVYFESILSFDRYTKAASLLIGRGQVYLEHLEEVPTASK